MFGLDSLIEIGATGVCFCFQGCCDWKRAGRGDVGAGSMCERWVVSSSACWGWCCRRSPMARSVPVAMQWLRRRVFPGPASPCSC